jgi:hypothetical protein
LTGVASLRFNERAPLFSHCERARVEQDVRASPDACDVADAHAHCDLRL